MATLSEVIADRVRALHFEQLPAAVVSTVKALILDHLGVAAFGSTTAWGKAVAETLRPLGGTQESSIYFSTDKVPALSAALVNGTFAHGFELDDHYRGVHAGCVVIPAGLAVAEREAIDGRGLITAIVCGYEVLARLATAMPHISDNGHHPTGTIGPFGSAVAAGKILALSPDQFVSAIGIAGNFPTGVCEFYKGTMEKRVFAGRASQSGILACLLARSGLTGARTIFEGEVGFCHTFSDHPDVKNLLDGLGQKFYTEEVNVKRYPCAGTNHPHIDAALALRDKYKDVLTPRNKVREIVIEGGKRYRGKDILNRRRSGVTIPDVMAAQYSIPYAVAVTLCRGRPGVEEFSESVIKDPLIQSFLAKCKVVRREKFRAMGKITVNFRDGSSVSQTVVDTNLPISDIDREAVVQKFLRLTSNLIDRKRAERVIETVQNLEGLMDVRQLTEILIPEASSSEPQQQ
ncbi:MAG: MmgE/PrpD family protein [Candidatus Binatia bacterium]